MSYEFFIAKRYFKSKRKTGFISLITYISIVGVTIGVAALVIVLSIMNGFESEVRSRFIGFDAHIRLQAYHNQGVKNFEKLLPKVEKVKEVVGISPFIMEKALVMVDEKVEGLILKGTDAKRVTSVTDIKQNITYGSLDFSEQADDNNKPLPGIVLGRYLAERLEAARRIRPERTDWR